MSPKRSRRRCNSAQAALETALVIPILLLLVCNFVALMVQLTVQQQLDSATALAAESRFQASESAYDASGTTCCPGADSVLHTGGLPTGCRYAAESFYGTMQSFGGLLTWPRRPLCMTGGDSGGAAPSAYVGSPLVAHVSCVVGSIDPRGVSHPAFLDRTLHPPTGLYVVTCDATATLNFAGTPLAWGVFWSPTLHAHAEALPPPFRQ